MKYFVRFRNERKKLDNPDKVLKEFVSFLNKVGIIFSLKNCVKQNSNNYYYQRHEMLGITFYGNYLLLISIYFSSKIII